MSRKGVFRDQSTGDFDDGAPIAVFPAAVASVFGRTGAVAAVAGDYFGAMPAALTGATQAARFVGATTSGAPASGTFAVGDVVVARDGHVFVCTTAGSPGTFTDVGAGASVSYATPSIVLGSSAAAGAASTVIRSDSTIAAFDATAPTTQAFGDSAAVGTAAFAARRDHKHGMPVRTISRSARTSDTILAEADRATVIAATAAYTQTLTAAATLGAGWWCIVQNNTQDGTTVLTLDPNASETIDGLTTIKMYSGETRLIECDGGNFTSQLLEGGYAKFVPSGLGTFVVPAGITACDVVCVGSGGQGGGGFSGSATASSGGGGGGGGAVTRAILRAGDLGAAGTSITVTAAVGGTGAGAPGAPGSDGANGATTSFGSFLKAGGGGGGKAGAAGASSNGAGGGSLMNNAATTTAGAPTSNAAIAGQGSTPGAIGTAGNSSEWGGASGGGSVTGASSIGKNGGGSIFGGPGGGAGGGTTTTVGQVAAIGGTTQVTTAGGGAGAGTSGGTTTKGGDGVFVGPYCGSGGGGGGAGSTGVAGKDGGAGFLGSGGGGGGSSANTTAGTGGVGGAGECRVWYA